MTMRCVRGTPVRAGPSLTAEKLGSLRPGQCCEVSCNIVPRPAPTLRWHTPMRRCGSGGTHPCRDVAEVLCTNAAVAHTHALAHTLCTNAAVAHTHVEMRKALRCSRCTELPVPAPAVDGGDN